MSTIPEFLVQMLEEQYHKEEIEKIIRRLFNKKKNYFPCKHVKSRNRRSFKSFRRKSNRI